MKPLQNLISIDLLRHGETTAGACFLGSTDVSLTDAGWQQMHAVLKPEKYQRIICSPLKRCVDFSRQLSEKNNIPLMIKESLREIHFGDWEAKPVDVIWETQPDLLSAFWQDPLNNTPPGGEKMQDFQNRVNVAFNEIRHKYNEEKILMVIHGGVIRQIIANVLSVPFTAVQKINVDYAGLSRLDCYAENISLAFINRQAEKQS